ncbi:hypothetical protein ACTOB_001597 [Actinoplanes oblitus]|uniref:WG containing repeat-containing protein n=1 Tax=Actinoplanes oblitus TaxID=3040509 RepID=A0ABY8WKU2_9ACTN|nr:WG repeat-containing protein [Actinoplanes oblitus]WIM98027.1 hypothetical protein ACTOB_001597 [Actinoplanes oblitus]
MSEQHGGWAAPEQATSRSGGDPRQGGGARPVSPAGLTYGSARAVPPEAFPARSGRTPDAPFELRPAPQERNSPPPARPAAQPTRMTPQQPAMPPAAVYPAAPGRNPAYPGIPGNAPVSGIASAPVSGFASAPVSGVTSAPVSGVAAAPVSGLASAPVSGVASAPVSGVASAPVTGVGGSVPGVWRGDLDGSGSRQQTAPGGAGPDQPGHGADGPFLPNDSTQAMDVGGVDLSAYRARQQGGAPGERTQAIDPRRVGPVAPGDEAAPSAGPETPFMAAQGAGTAFAEPDAPVGGVPSEAPVTGTPFGAGDSPVAGTPLATNESPVAGTPFGAGDSPVAGTPFATNESAVGAPAGAGAGVPVAEPAVEEPRGLGWLLSMSGLGAETPVPETSPLAAPEAAEAEERPAGWFAPGLEDGPDETSDDGSTAGSDVDDTVGGDNVAAEMADTDAAQAADGTPAADDSVQGDSAEGEWAQRDSIQDDPVQADSVQDDPVQGDSAEGEWAQRDSVQDDSAADDSVQGDRAEDVTVEARAVETPVGMFPWDVQLETAEAGAAEVPAEPVAARHSHAWPDEDFAVDDVPVSPAGPGRHERATDEPSGRHEATDSGHPVGEHHAASDLDSDGLAPVSAIPVSAAPTSAFPVPATPISAAPTSAIPVSAAPLSATPEFEVTPVSATPVSAPPEFEAPPVTAAPESEVAPISAAPEFEAPPVPATPEFQAPPVPAAPEFQAPPGSGGSGFEVAPPVNGFVVAAPRVPEWPPTNPAAVGAARDDFVAEVEAAEPVREIGAEVETAEPVREIAVEPTDAGPGYEIAAEVPVAAAIEEAAGPAIVDTPTAHGADSTSAPAGLAAEVPVEAEERVEDIAAPVQGPLVPANPVAEDRLEEVVVQETSVTEDHLPEDALDPETPVAEDRVDNAVAEDALDQEPSVAEDHVEEIVAEDALGQEIPVAEEHVEEVVAEDALDQEIPGAEDHVEDVVAGEALDPEDSAAETLDPEDSAAEDRVEVADEAAGWAAPAEPETTVAEAAEIAVATPAEPDATPVRADDPATASAIPEPRAEGADDRGGAADPRIGNPADDREPAADPRTGNPADDRERAADPRTEESGSGLAPIRQRRDQRAPADRRRADPEQILAAYPWMFDPATLREQVGDPDRLWELADRLTDRLEFAERDNVRAGLLSLRAVVSRVLGELDDALADGREALRHAEAAGVAHLVSITQARLAHVLQWRGEFAEADRLYARADSPELPARARAEIRELAGRSAFEQGRFLEAVNHFERALDLCQGGDPELVERVELALDVMARRSGDGWGPYPRSREQVLGLPPTPTPLRDDGTSLWGYAAAVEPRYAEAQPFAEGVAWVRRPDSAAWELIDPAGQVLIGADSGYLAAGRFAEGLAWVSRDAEGGWFAVDRGNRLVVSGGFEDVRPFRRGLALVKRGGWGAVDRHGRIAVQPKYHGFATVLSAGGPIDGFSDEGLAVVDAGTGSGVVDRTGQPVVPPVHKAVVIHPSAFLIADEAGRWGALDRQGQPLVETRYVERADAIEEVVRLRPDNRPVL